MTNLMLFETDSEAQKLGNVRSGIQPLMYIKIAFTLNFVSIKYHCLYLYMSFLVHLDEPGVSLKVFEWCLTFLNVMNCTIIFIHEDKGHLHFGANGLVLVHQTSHVYKLRDTFSNILSFLKSQHVSNIFER